MSEQDRRDRHKRPFQSKSQEVNVSETAAPEQPADDWAAAMSEQQAAEQSAVKTPAPAFQKLAPGNAPEARNDIDMILDIPVQLTVELGRTKIAIKNLLQLAQGSVVELDGLAGEPMDVLVNGCLIAQGEVVVVNEKFGIRLTDIVTPSERMRQLNR
jgi:flagellar motor switch protein FliN